MNAPDTSLTVRFVPDVLSIGLFYGCMASNGARAASAPRFKLFSGEQHSKVMALGHRDIVDCLQNLSALVLMTLIH